VRLIFCIIFVSFSCFAFGDGNHTVTIRFTPKYNYKPVVFENEYYQLSTGDSIVCDVLRYYITGIKLLSNGGNEFAEQDSYHLVDHSNEATTTITLNVPDNILWTQIQFNLGIDSATNTAGALTGDLDPIKGMYWAWQSGYINFKLEGRSSACPTRKNEFSFHLGGYLPPGYAIQQINRSLTRMNEIDITFHLDKFLQGIDLEKQNSIMIPGREAVELAKKAAEAFMITTP
jgi:hypothetical protein